jgi:hypothetical protein
MLPHTDRMARGEEHLYFFYQMTGGSSYSLTDVDGEPLIAVHDFETLVDADAWATEDARQRQALLDAEGRAQ